MRKVAWLHRGVMRRISSRDLYADYLECGHSVPRDFLRYGNKFRRCKVCRDVKVDELVASL